MTAHPPIRLVCFDLGGVLIRICRTWLEGLDAAGLPVRGDLTARLRDVKPLLHELVVKHQTGRVPGDEYYEQFSRALGGLYTPAEVERVHHAWLIDQYDGVDQLVEAIRRCGIITAALSNTNHAHWGPINDYPAVRLLHHRFASHEIGRHKPDRGAYEHVESTLSVQKTDVLFFDDLPENIHAAQQRGWRAVQIDHTGDTAAQMRHSLNELGFLL